MSRAVEDGSLFENEALVGAFRRARERDADVHLLGLVSTGGVHSHIGHLRALLELARRAEMEERTWIHAFTDGRDVSPHAAATDLASLPPERIATVVGRYYAMDRDERWERTDRAVDAIVGGIGESADDPVAAVRASYERGVTDEFVEPVVLRGRPRLDPATRRRSRVQLPARPRSPADPAAARGGRRRRHDDPLPGRLRGPVAFAEQTVPDTLAEVLSADGRRQLHAAETEKYAHVTYFFNGGVEEPWDGEERILVPSPRDVASYDLKPEMSAREVAARVAAALGDGISFCVVNFANPDMVGHTGVIPAVVTAVETADACLGVVVEATHRAGGVCLVTADHGNAEKLLEDDGVSPHTAHTTNPVPLVLTLGGAGLRDGGELSDIAPTVLDLLGLGQPDVMTGTTLAALGNR